MKSRMVAVFVVLMLLASGLACASESATVLNEGKGTREDPIAARKYAKAASFEVRALSVIYETLTEDATPAPQETPAGVDTLKVQFEIKCTRGPDEICDLGEMRNNLKLVSSDGIIYEPILDDAGLEESDRPLQGEILGGAQQAGWMAYQIPTGIQVTLALAEFGEGERVFFKLP